MMNDFTFVLQQQNKNFRYIQCNNILFIWNGNESIISISRNTADFLEL